TEEAHQVADHAYRAGPVVENDHRAGGKPAAGLADDVIVQRQIQMLGQQEVCRAAPWQEGAQLIAVTHSPGTVLQQLADGCAQWQLPATGILHPAADAAELGAGVGTHAEPLVPVHPELHDATKITNRLDVVHDGRLAPQPAYLRKGRLGPGIGPLAFQCIEQCSLLPTDVAPGAGMQDDLQIEAGTKNVATQQSILL